MASEDFRCLLCGAPNNGGIECLQCLTERVGQRIALIDYNGDYYSSLTHFAIADAQEENGDLEGAEISRKLGNSFKNREW